MALMERVATLLRANLNDMVDRAEDPEKMIRQFVLDMENQLLQVKTQVAIALADQHLLERKVAEQEELVSSWHRRAELAVGKADDALARAALGRVLHHEHQLTAFRAQVEDQTEEAAALRASFVTLQDKLIETKGRCERLIDQHRRARILSKAAEAQAAAQNTGADKAGKRAKELLQSQTDQIVAQTRAADSLQAGGTLEDRLAQLERDDQVEQLLAQLKSGKRLLPAS